MDPPTSVLRFSKLVYEARDWIIFLTSLYLVIQSGVVMLYMRGSVSVVVALTPTYVVVFSLPILLLLMFYKAKSNFFDCDIISIWMLSFSIAFFTALGIAKLQHPDLNFMAVFLPPLTIICPITVTYMISLCSRLQLKMRKKNFIYNDEYGLDA
jgi:hypothetical protein